MITQLRFQLHPLLVLLVLSVSMHAVPSHAQGVHPETGERLFGGFTEAEVEAMAPTSPNPYLAWLPAGVEPDYRYWRARTALESYRRAERRGELAPPARLFTVAETEADGAIGENDTYETAEFITGFGTGASAFSPVVTISGSLTDADAVFEPAEPFAEDDGSIPLASDTGLDVGEGIIVEEAVIGDGPHGSTTGDFDFYAIDAAESQILYIQLLGGGGDLLLALYDPDGFLVTIRGVRDASVVPIVFRAPAPGSYYAAVFGAQNGGIPMLADPFEAASGPGVGATGSYDLLLSLTERDVDVFSFDLEAGDVLGVGEGTGSVNLVEILGPQGQVMMGTGIDFSSAFPEDSPLPSGGNAGAATVAHEAGTYAVAVWGGGSGNYSFGVHAFRPRTETEPGATQVLFVDFDGATIDAEEVFGFGNPNAVLTPMADFLPAWGLEPDDEGALIDAIMTVLVENLDADLLRHSNNPSTGVILRNSRDHTDPGDAPYVSRLIVGGTVDELGIPTVGIASGIDPGNFGLEDVGVTLLDTLSAPVSGGSSLNRFDLAPGAEKLDLVALGVGNITAHEAGHLLGLFHTDTTNPIVSIEDEGGILANITGVGPDHVFGTDDDFDVDFVTDGFSPLEPWVGFEDQLNIVAFGLTESTPVAAENAQPEGSAIAPLYPNPLGAGGVATLEVRSARDEHVRVRVYDVAGRLVRTAFEGAVRPGVPQVVPIESGGLAAGTYLVRVEGEHESATRRLTVVR